MAGGRWRARRGKAKSPHETRQAACGKASVSAGRCRQLQRPPFIFRNPFPRLSVSQNPHSAPLSSRTRSGSLSLWRGWEAALGESFSNERRAEDLHAVGRKQLLNRCYLFVRIVVCEPALALASSSPFPPRGRTPPCRRPAGRLNDLCPASRSRRSTRGRPFAGGKPIRRHRGKIAFHPPQIELAPNRCGQVISDTHGGNSS